MTPPLLGETMDLQLIFRNRNSMGLEELAKYAGRYVAWRPDGTGVFASDEDEIRLDAAIRAEGLDPSEILVSFVPASDEVVLGGGEVSE
jgi:hypothetical protein